MIHPVDDVFVISAGHVWRPGVFASRVAARIGQRRTDEELTSLQARLNREARERGESRGVIRVQDL